MDEFGRLMRDITDRQLAIMGLPPLKAAATEVPDVSTMDRLASRESPRPTGNPDRDTRQLAPSAAPDNDPVQVGSPLYERLRIDALEWPPEGKDYGRSPVYKDRDGVLRISVDECEP